jgi:hypothetical protein
MYTDYNLGYVSGSTSVRQYQEGTLVIFFGDPETKQVIWQGSGTEAFQNPTQATINWRVGEVVKNLLKKFPPED